MYCVFEPECCYKNEHAPMLLVLRLENECIEEEIHVVQVLHTLLGLYKNVFRI